MIRREFENQFFYNLEKFCGIEHSRTTPYHPAGNGQVERFNRTLLGMLRTLTMKEKSDWKAHLNKVVHAYNFTKHDTTGFAPFYLLFGRPPRLPVDIVFGLAEPKESVNQAAYVRKWQDGLREAFEIARSNIKKSSAKAEKHYNQGPTCSVLFPGDRVLVRNFAERGGPGKLRSHWEQTVYVVVKRMSEDSPVYEIKPETGDGRIRVMHRNSLLPCDFLGQTDVGTHKAQRKDVEEGNKRQESATRSSSTVPPPPDFAQYTGSLNPYASEFTPSSVPEDIVPMSEDEEASSLTCEHGDEVEFSDDDGSISDDSEDEQWHRPSRDRRPPLKLTYDVLGEPEYKAVMYLPVAIPPWMTYWCS